jgi:hypothetical protein
VPLSEHEQHLLEQMEQAMYAEDPRFASSMQGSLSRARLRRRAALGAVAFLVGLGLIVLAVMNPKATVWLGAAGFAVMVAAVAYALTPAKVAKPPLGTVAADGTVRRFSASARPKGTPSRGKRGAKPAGGFMARMEQRWDKRRGNWQ